MSWGILAGGALLWLLICLVAYACFVVGAHWPTPLRDRDIADRLGRHRGVIYRKGREIGLPPRRKGRGT